MFNDPAGAGLNLSVFTKSTLVKLLRDINLLPSACRYVELQRRSVAGEFANASQTFGSSSETPLGRCQPFLPIHALIKSDRLFHHICEAILG